MNVTVLGAGAWGTGLAVHLDGVGGDFAGEHHRWDLVPHEGGTYFLYTTGSDAVTKTPESMRRSTSASSAGDG